MEEKEEKPIIYTIHPCDGCCWIYNPKSRSRVIPLNDGTKNQKRIRAGVFVFNDQTKQLLVVQTYNQFIGLPKGGVELGESLKEGAIRETKEETGIDLSIDQLSDQHSIQIHQTATYFIVRTTQCFPVKINDQKNNDVTGAGWIHINCLSKLPGQCTSHLIAMVRRVLNHDISKDRFLTVPSFVPFIPNIEKEIPSSKIKTGKFRRPGTLTIPKSSFPILLEDQLQNMKLSNE